MAGSGTGRSRRALIYIRVSTARDDMISPELQQFQGETLAAKEDMQLVGKPITDLGKTGRSFGERQISKIIGMAEREEFDVLILWVWSRFGRNMKDSLTNLDRLTELGIEVRAVKEDFDGRTNIGRFAIRQMLNIAELFSDQQADVWKESIARRRRKGLPHANQGRFGYYRCDTCPPRKSGVPLETCPACKEGILKVDPVLGPKLADAWRRVAAGEFIAHITHEWYAEGVVDPASGKPVTPGRLYDILDSGFGLGFVRYRLPEQQHVLRADKDGVKRRGRNRSRRPETFGLYLPGGHEPVISDRAECERVWDAYLDRRGDTPKAAARARGEIRYSTTGLVFCAACGGSMHALLRAKKTRKPPIDGRPDPFDVTWRCRQYAELGSCRGSGYGNLEHIEVRVLDWLMENAKGGQDIQTRVRRSQTALKPNDSAARLTGIERELERLVRQEDRLTDSLVDGLINEDAARRKQERINARREELEAERQQLSERRERMVSQPGAVAFKSLVDEWEQATPNTRNKLIKTVVRGIYVRKGRGLPLKEKYQIVPMWEAHPAAASGAPSAVGAGL
ncbi:recombinase family protein [Streptomyces sp. B21-104]|uniref:recombinase family protein n=1 Tax=Streptomyces sp. B21-104 TaxID=3039421 RepID=UPI0030D61127